MSDLSKELVKSFTELMKESTDSSSKTLNVYGTLKETDDGKFVRIDGSDQYTPITEVTEAKDGDRVLVTIENHSAVVIGNYTFPPSARTANEALDNSKENAKEIVKVNEAVVEAQLAADQAKFDADDAAKAADEAMSNAIQAQQTASQALSSANEATIKADEAQNAIDDMDISMTQLNKDLDEVQTAVSAAQTSADAAQTSANEAKAANAATQAELETTKTAVTNAQTTANTAVENASRAHSAANEAQSSADKANALATEIQKDADKALEEIEDLSSNLETLENTMTTDYARKTDLSSVESSMQTQISQNAAAIESTASKVTTMDTTFSKKAQDALDAAEAAQSSADAAQTAADNANAEAISAQNAASQAAQAAANAQTQADTAKSAAQAADAKAVTAQNELDTAKANLEAVTSRVGVTEEEITAAQSAVTAAQAAADKAQQDATKANEDAVKAQSTANAAKSDAEKAQTNANNAVQKAEAAQSVANEAKANAESAVTAANTAKTTADAAKETATNAKTTAENAQSIADEAAANAANAQSIADAAQAKVTETQNDLNTAKANLEAVTSRVGVTEEEITAAQAAVTAAQAAADKAKEDAATAQSTANTAKNNAATAQAAADQAQAAAEQAQTDADAAQAAADKAQDDVDKLAVTVTEQETKITQNAEAIQLRATKTDVTNTLTGYYTKTETDSAINVKADSITQTVASTYTTKDEFNDLSIGGRNLIVNSAFLDGVTSWGYIGKEASEVDTTFTFNNHPTLKINATGNTEFKWEGRANYYLPKRDVSFTTGTTLTLSAWYYVEDKTTFDKNLVVEFKGKKPNATYATTIIAIAVQPENIIEGTWIKSTKTITLDSDYSGCSVYPHVQRNGTVWFADLKLEEGNKATAWSPAHEDYSTTTEMNSAIQQKADSITQTVAATYTTKNEFNNLNIGGRNLALDTNSYYAGWRWSLGQGGYQRTDFVEDGVICAKLTRDDVAMAYWSVISYDHTKIKLNLLKPNTQYVISFDVKTDIVMNFSCSIRHMNGQHLLVVIEKPTVPNTVPNEWTTVSCVLTTLDTIELNEQVLYMSPNNSDVGRSYSFRNLKIEEGNKPTAWTPAPEDVAGDIQDVADDLANNYSTTTEMNSAIQQKADSILSTVSTNYPDNSEMNSAIQQKADSITSTVAATYTTKDEFNNLSIGGRNLIPDSGNFTDSLGKWVRNSNDNSIEIDSTVKYAGFNTIKINNQNNSGMKYDDFIYNLKPNTVYTYSITAKSSKKLTAAGNEPLHMWLKENHDDSNPHREIILSISHATIDTQWGRSYIVFKTPNDSESYIWKPFIYFNTIGGDPRPIIHVANFQLEEGNRPTAWTPAIDEYSTTTQMNSAIQQKADSITSTVAATYTTKDEFNNLSVGSRNYILNGNFQGCIRDTTTIPKWNYWGNVRVYIHQGYSGYNTPGTLYLMNNTDSDGGIYQVISRDSIPKNTEFTLSFNSEIESQVKFVKFGVDYRDSSNAVLHEKYYTIDITKGRKTFTFTTPNVDYTNVRVIFQHGGSTSTSGSFLWIIRNVKLEKGNKATDFSPAPEDVQGEIDKVSDNLANNYSTTTQMNSAIQQKADSITQTVAATYTTKTEFNNLSIGGRNLLPKNGISNSSPNVITASFDETSNTWTMTHPLSATAYQGLVTRYGVIRVPYGKTLCVSWEMKVPRSCKVNYDINNTPAEGDAWHGNDNDVDRKGKYGSFEIPQDVAGQWVKYYFTYTNGHASNTNKVDLIDQSKLGIDMTNETEPLTYQIRNYKFEYGNRPTDYSPCPSDYSTTNQMNSAIQQKADSILSTVSTNYPDNSEMNSAIQQKADSILSTVSTNYPDNNEMNSAIQQKADSITSTVAATYTTKDEFNNLSIGGRNLISNSAFLDGTTYWDCANNSNTTTTVDNTMIFNGHPSLKITSSGWTTMKWYGARNWETPRGNTSIKAEEIVTISCWYYVRDKSKFDSSIGFEIKGDKDDGAGGIAIYLIVEPNDIVENKWTRVTKTAKVPYNLNNIYSFLYVIQNGEVWFADIKFEKGNKATAWTPAPEDYSTTTQMNSAIEQKADSITSTVAATYTTKNEFNNLSVGSRNYILNGNFKGCVANTTTVPKWNLYGNSKVYIGQGGTNYNQVGTLYLQNNSSEVSTMYQNISAEKIPKNTIISFSCNYTVESNVNSVMVQIEYISSSHEVLSNQIIINDKNAGRHEVTITTPNVNYSYMRLIFRHGGSSSSTSSYLWMIQNVKLEKGNKATDFSPAPEDYSTTDETTAQMNSAIQQKADSITSTVASTYTTKDEFNNLSIGGTNILSKEYIVPMGGYDHAVNDFIYSMRVNNQYQGISIIPEFSDLLTIGEVYTLQFKFRKVSGQLDHVGMHIDGNTFIIEGSTCDGEDKNIMHPTANTWNVNDGNWHICIIRMRKFATTPSTTIGLFVIQPNRESTNEVIAEIKDIKFEKGSKMTDWSPAPKDMVSTSQMNSAIQQTASSITSTVASTYTTKDEFNNLSIDNTNLFRYSRPYLLDSSGVSGKYNVGRGNLIRDTLWALSGEDECYSLTLSSGQSNAYCELKNAYREMEVVEGQTYYFSLDFAFSEYCTGINVHLYKGNTWLANIFPLTKTTPDSSIIIRHGEKSWTATFTGTVYLTIYNAGTLDATKESVLYFTNLKFEKGTKATTWTPHPEDVKGSIDATATEIRSELEQTATSITAKFKDTGGYNMIRNSSGLCNDGVPGWSTSSNLTVQPVITNMDARQHFQSGRCLTIHTSSPSEQYLFSDRIKLKPNTTYTISGRYATDDNSKGIDVFVLTSNTLDVTNAPTNTDTSYDTVAAHFPNDSASQWWYSFSRTFTTGPSVKSAYVRIDHNGKLESSTASTSYNWIGDLLLTEGSLVQKWSPHPEEVYTGITKIDKNGLTVSQTGYNGYTIMSANGFFVNDGTENVVQCTTNGLTVKGKINVISGSTVPTSTLSGQVTSTQISDNAITTDKIQANAIVGSKIKVNSVNGDRIVAGSIKGDKLTTNSISTKHLTIGDINNYSELNTDTAEALGFTIIESDQAKNPWFKLNTLQRDTTLNHKGAHNAFENIGEGTYKITYEMSSTVQGYKNSDGSGTPAYLRINIGMYSMKQNGSYSWPLVLGQYGDADGSQHSVSGYITLPSDIKSFGIALQLEGWGPFTGECKIRNVKVEKMTDHALIVNGSVTAAKIATNAITSDKIAANAITADKIAAGAISASHIEGNTLTGTTIVGGTFKNTDNSFSVDSSGNITGAAMSGGTINIGDGAFKVANTGNLKIGGLTGQTIGGYERAQFEVTSTGTVYSVGTDGAYTKMSEGRLYCYNGSNSTTIEGSTITADDLLIGEITNRSGQGLQFNGGGHTVYLRNSSGAGYFDPSVTNSLRLGSTSALWKVGYIVEGVKNSSDRTMKENIQYIPSSNTNYAITTRGCLDFITKDYALATYNYIDDEDKKTKLSAIAQDLLVNEDGSDNVIGQLIVDCEEAANDSSKLTMSQTQLVNVLIGAVQELTKEVNELKAKLKETE